MEEITPNLSMHVITYPDPNFTTNLVLLLKEASGIQPN